jgi:hypothetical protein
MLDTIKTETPTEFDVKAHAEAILETNHALQEMGNHPMRFIYASRFAGLTEAWTLMTQDREAVRTQVNERPESDREEFVDNILTQARTIVETNAYLAKV